MLKRNGGHLDGGVLHEPLALVALEGGEHVGNQRSNESSHGEVHLDRPVLVLLERGKADTSDDGDEAEPLGSGDLLPVAMRETIS